MCYCGGLSTSGPSDLRRPLLVQGRASGRITELCTNTHMHRSIFVVRDPRPTQPTASSQLSPISRPHDCISHRPKPPSRGVQRARLGS